MASTLAEEEAPPAYDDAPAALSSAALSGASALSPLSPSARYTPSQFSDLYSSHYTPLNADYAVITAPIPPRQYSMDLRAGAHNAMTYNDRAAADRFAADRVAADRAAASQQSAVLRPSPFSPVAISVHQHNV